MDFDICDALDDLGKSVSTMNVIEMKQRSNLPNEDSIACLRYAGVLKSDEAIKEAIEKGTKSIEFSQLVEWFAKELQALNDMESCILSISDPEDSSSFLMEVSSFLKELQCPYQSLTDGPISQRLLDVQSRRTLLDYLCTELMAARRNYLKKDKVDNFMEIELEESSTASCLQNAMDALNIEAHNVSSNIDDCFNEIENKVKAVLEKNPKSMPPSVISETLSQEQWDSLSTLYEDFFSEYTVRRKLLLTRLEVTIQSFTWGENSKGKENKIVESYHSRYQKLKQKPSVKLSDIIAAKEDLLIVEKTSSANLVKNTKSEVNKVLIPAVPDRGGRPKEQRPPVEMPNWSKRQGGDGQGGYRGGGNWRGQGRGKKFRGNQHGKGDRKKGW